MEAAKIVRQAAALYPEMVAVRRQLHARPERSFAEHLTARILTERLGAAGIVCRPIAGTGVLAALPGRRPGRRAVVLRADTDALPLREPEGVEGRSLYEGMMHACGHDLHSAALYGALRLLAPHAGAWEGTVFGLFQPGEERNPGGASIVLAEEPFAGYDVAAVFGLHIEPELPTGTFGLRVGRYMAASDELHLTVEGRGGHAALREQLVDPIPAAAAWITALREAADASVDPQSPVVLSIGRVVADGATNVVPDRVEMQGTLRTFDAQVRRKVQATVEELARRTEERFGVRCTVRIDRGYPPVVNDAALAAAARGAMEALWGPGRCRELALRPTSEDFGFYAERYPALFFRLGAGQQAVDPTECAPWPAGRTHHPSLRPNEHALLYGAATLAALALRMMETNNENE